MTDLSIYEQIRQSGRKQMKKQPDRRVRRTRQLLQKALIELILEKRYDKITVQDIIDRANVGRSTFYAHFQDKEDLLVSGFDMFNQSLEAHVEVEGRDAGFLHSLAFFEHAAGHHDLYRAMREGGGSELLFNTAQRHVEAQLTRHLQDAVPAGHPLPIEILSSYLSGAMLSLLLWWLDNDVSVSPVEINEMFQTLARATMTAVAPGAAQ